MGVRQRIPRQFFRPLKPIPKLMFMAMIQASEQRGFDFWLVTIERVVEERSPATRDLRSRERKELDHFHPAGK